MHHVSLLWSVIATLLLLTSCYYQGEEATLYAVGDNFELSADSLTLQSSRPLHNQPVDTLCERPCIYRGDPLVVAEIEVMPEDTQDSVWVKLARDQYTMGWVHQRDFIESVVPDDPISKFIHLFSIKHTGVFAILFAISLLVLIWQINSPRRPCLFFFRDILSPYPTILVITLAASALLYAGIQRCVPQTWMLYYYHPTLNPFELPTILSLFLCSVWMLVILTLATIDEVRRQLSPAETVLYLTSLLGCCILSYLLFTLAAFSPVLGGILLVLFAFTLLLRHYRHSHPHYLCGKCGAKLTALGKCPRCGAENV